MPARGAGLRAGRGRRWRTRRSNSNRRKRPGEPCARHDSNVRPLCLLPLPGYPGMGSGLGRRRARMPEGWRVLPAFRPTHPSRWTTGSLIADPRWGTRPLSRLRACRGRTANWSPAVVRPTSARSPTRELADGLGRPFRLAGLRTSDHRSSQCWRAAAEVATVLRAIAVG
jgi:hypothetical protein